jgi:hypothetical protein
MEEPKMPENPTIVAVNGSPHAGVGNTSMMIEMLRDPLSQEGFNLEIINLCGKEIDYCYGCGFCLEKGKCWIDDDHRSIAKRLLAADGIILASPVYIFSVTAQMKTFLDRPGIWPQTPLSLEAWSGRLRIRRFRRNRGWWLSGRYSQDIRWFCGGNLNGHIGWAGGIHGGRDGHHPGTGSGTGFGARHKRKASLSSNGP